MPETAEGASAPAEHHQRSFTVSQVLNLSLSLCGVSCKGSPIYVGAELTVVFPLQSAMSEHIFHHLFGQPDPALPSSEPSHEENGTAPVM